MALHNSIHKQLRSPIELLDFIEKYNFKADSKLFLLICASKNVRDFIEKYTVYHNLFCPWKIFLHKSEFNYAIELVPIELVNKYKYLILFFEFCTLVKLLRKITGKDVNALKIELCGRFSDSKIIRTFFGCPVNVGNKNIMYLSLENLNEPISDLKEDLWSILEEKLQKEKDYLKCQNLWGNRVRNILLDMVPNGNFDIGIVAYKLNISVRSLQRYLKLENTNFQIILRDVRVSMAKFYLKYTTLSVNKIALLLGYKELHPLIKLIQDSTGMSCMEYRKSKLL